LGLQISQLHINTAHLLRINPAANVVAYRQVPDNLIVAHSCKIYYGFTAALAVAAAFCGGHTVPILVAGLRDVKVFDSDHLEIVFHNDAYNNTIP